MAVVNIYEVAPVVERLIIVDAAAVADQEIYNKTGNTYELTFVKDEVQGGTTHLVPDDTVPLGTILPGGSYTVTTQQINDAIAAGNHSDIYTFSRREQEVSSIPRASIVVGGVTQPGRKAKAKK
jgi:hypothetical protein